MHAYTHTHGCRPHTCVLYNIICSTSSTQTRMQGDFTADVVTVGNQSDNMRGATKEDDNPACPYSQHARRSSEPLHSYTMGASSSIASVRMQYQSSSFDACQEETWRSTQKQKATRRKCSTAAIQEMKKLLPLQFAQKSQEITIWSPDMEARIYKKIRTSLGEKYGSLERVTQAAVTIQKAYRGYKLRKHFDEIRREGTAQVSRRSNVAAKERRQMLRQQAVDLYELDLMLGVDDVKSSDVCGHLGVPSGGAPDDDALVALADSNGDVHKLESSTRTGCAKLTLKRSKSLLTTKLTKSLHDEGEGGVVEEEEEEEEEEDETARWKRTVGVHLFNRWVWVCGQTYLIWVWGLSCHPHQV